MQRTNPWPLFILLTPFGLPLAFLEVEEARESHWIRSMSVSGVMGEKKALSIFPLEPGSSTSQS